MVAATLDQKKQEKQNKKVSKLVCNQKTWSINQKAFRELMEVMDLNAIFLITSFKHELKMRQNCIQSY